MPVSSINAGIASGQPSLKGAMAQRAYQQELPTTMPVAPGAPERVSTSAPESSPGNVYATAPIGSQTGVAAYVAIMNPSFSTSMRIEA